MSLLISQFSIYFLGMLIIGYLSMRYTRDNQGYIIGGRSMGPYTSALSAGASDMSAWLLLGLPGAVFAGGLVDGFWISIGLLLGAWCNWYFVAPRLRASTEELGVFTIPAWLAQRFNDNSGVLKISSAIVILLFFTLYVASGLKGGTLLFAHTFSTTESISLFVTLFVVVSYTFLGGYVAVCWTDLIQGILMMLALIFCAVLTWNSLAGGFPAVIASKEAAFSLSTGWITALSLLAWGLGYFGQPHILTRFIAIRGVAEITTARRVGISWMFVCLVMAVTIGLLGIGFQAQENLPGLVGEGGDSERLFLLLTSTLFHPVVSGFVLAAVLAAVMSTADSQLLVLASTLTEDNAFFAKLEQKKLTRLSRLCVVGFALLAWAIAANDQGSILALVGYAWSGFGAAFGPLILLSLWYPRVNKWGALAGILSGAISVVLFKNFVKIEGEYFFELLPAFFVSAIAILVVSRFSRDHNSQAH